MRVIVQKNQWENSLKSMAVSAFLIVVLGVLAVPVTAVAHGGSGAEDFEAEISSVEPKGLPVDFQIRNDDELRVELVDETGAEFMLCGYKSVDECDEYVRIDEEGVFVNENSVAYYNNQDDERPAAAPESAGEGDPEFEQIRDGLRFFSYHDHRLHWMSDTPPPNVDSGSSKRQLVNEFTIDFIYNGEPGSVNGALYYVGGAPWYIRYAELILGGFGVAIMGLVFARDHRRRKRLVQDVSE